MVINTPEEMELACGVFMEFVKEDTEPIVKYLVFREFLQKKAKVNLSFVESEKIIFRKIYAPQHFQEEAEK